MTFLDLKQVAEDLKLAAPVPLTRHPAAVYLAALSQGSRPTMHHALNAIASLLTGSECDALTLEQVSGQLRPTLSRLLQKIQTALTQSDSDLFTTEQADIEAKERVLHIITEVNLRSYERDIKDIWDSFTSIKNLDVLVEDLDELFVDQQLYDEIDKPEDVSALEMIKAEDVQLVCYQWFKPG